jgi:hypothetical protein
MDIHLATIAFNPRNGSLYLMGRPSPPRQLGRRSMLTKLTLFLAAATTVAMISWQAQATPMAAAKQIYQAKEITLVVNSCVPGWHWSPAAGRCVRNGR